MADHIHLDFETYSSLDLTLVGAMRYAEAPDADVLCCAVAFSRDLPTVVNLQAQPRHPFLNKLFDALRNGATLVAHNSQFERVIWEKICIPKLGWPDVVKPEQWDCTAVRAAAMGLPRSLAGASAALGLNVQKDPTGAKLIQLFCKPDRNGRRTLWNEKPEEFRRLMLYCKQDVVVEQALDRRLRPLHPFDRRLFHLDYQINARGVPVSVPLIRRAIDAVEDLREQAVARVKEISGFAPTQRDRLLEWLNSNGAGMPDLTAQTVEDRILDTSLPAEARELLELRIEASRAGLPKLEKMLACASEDGRIRGAFMYYAATTARWSSVNVQFHNLARGDKRIQNLVISMLESQQEDLLPLLFDRPMTAMSKSIRGFITAPPGRQLTVVDYSAIEARILAWVAQEPFILNEYRANRDVYKTVASSIFGVPYGKVNEDQRFFGKQTVLGAGYMLGPGKFVETCKRFGVSINMGFAKRVISSYRESVPHIVAFWSAVEHAAVRAVLEGKPQRVNMLCFGIVGEDLHCVLPSGRAIVYPEPSVRMEEFTYVDATTKERVRTGKVRPVLYFNTTYGGQWVEESTYGGKLTENIVQAIARDFLGCGMIVASDAGYDLFGHVHDELQTETPEGDTTASKELEHLVCKLPPWLATSPLGPLPAGAEAYSAKHYRK